MTDYLNLPNHDNQERIANSLAELAVNRTELFNAYEVERTETFNTNEGLRQDNETTREANESTRLTNESGRVSAESARVTAYNAHNVRANDDHTTATSDHAQALLDKAFIGEVELQEASRVRAEGQRAAIFDGWTDEATGLEAQFNNAINGVTIDSEVIDARGGYVTLQKRLNSIDKKLNDLMIDASNPPAPLVPMVADGDFYDAVNFKYYSDVAMTIPATDNAPALQALVDYVWGQGGGTIYLPKGNYVVRSRTLWRSRTSLVGAGKSVSNIFAEGTIFSVIQGRGWYGDGSQANDPSVWLEDYRMADFCIDNKGLSSPYSSVDGKALFLLYNRRATFERLVLKNTIGTAMGCDFLPDCVINGVVAINAGRNWGQPRSAENANPSTIGQSGIGIGTGALEWEPLIVTNCFVYNCGNFGIFIEDQKGDTTGAYGKGAKIIGNHVENNRIGLANLGTGESLFADNFVYNNREQGFNAVRGANDMTVSDNHIFANQGKGIFVDNYKPNKNIQFKNNYIHHNTSHGIHIGIVGALSTHYIDSFTIEGNTICDNNRMGIFVEDNRKRYLNIKNNVVYNNGKSPTVPEDKTGIRINGGNENIFIVGNTFYDNQDIATQIHGLRMYGAITDYLIKDNNFTTQGTYIVPTTGKVKSNIGLVDNDIVVQDKHAFGKVSFAIGAEYIYVNHYLGRAPDSITITPLGQADVWLFENTEANRSRLRRADTTTSLDVYWDAYVDM